jgi:hypothetical protein
MIDRRLRDRAQDPVGHIGRPGNLKEVPSAFHVEQLTTKTTTKTRRHEDRTKKNITKTRNDKAQEILEKINTEEQSSGERTETQTGVSAGRSATQAVEHGRTRARHELTYRTPGGSCLVRVRPRRRFAAPPNRVQGVQSA